MHYCLKISGVFVCFFFQVKYSVQNAMFKYFIHVGRKQAKVSNVIHVLLVMFEVYIECSSHISSILSVLLPIIFS